MAYKKGDLQPPYALAIAQGYVIGDYSEADKFGCVYESCEERMFEYAGRNTYLVFKGRWIKRITPNGDHMILTWVKELDPPFYDK